MKNIVIVDDMKSARNILARLLSEYDFINIIGSFSKPSEAIEFIKSNNVDLVFIDIEMPEMNGLLLAEKIDKLNSNTYFIFATAYSEYSLKAWATNAIGYITKPYDKKELKNVIDKFLNISPRKNRVIIECFPNFNVLINNESVIFNSSKAKEILAYLVFNKGGWVTINEICVNVLEDLEDNKAKDSLRSYISRLKKVLSSYEISEILEQSYGKYRIVTSNFDCDYYEYLEGNKNLFMGEFLKSYTWAEPALAVMELSINNY